MFYPCPIRRFTSVLREIFIKRKKKVFFVNSFTWFWYFIAMLRLQLRFKNWSFDYALVKIFGEKTYFKYHQGIFLLTTKLINLGQLRMALLVAFGSREHSDTCCVMVAAKLDNKFVLAYRLLWGFSNSHENVYRKLLKYLRLEV